MLTEEMGLGKTVEMITLILKNRAPTSERPALPDQSVIELLGHALERDELDARRSPACAVLSKRRDGKDNMQMRDRCGAY